MSNMIVFLRNRILPLDQLRLDQIQLLKLSLSFSSWASKLPPRADFYVLIISVQLYLIVLLDVTLLYLQLMVEVTVARSPLHLVLVVLDQLNLPHEDLPLRHTQFRP